MHMHMYMYGMYIIVLSLLLNHNIIILILVISIFSEEYVHRMIIDKPTVQMGDRDVHGSIPELLDNPDVF